IRAEIREEFRTGLDWLCTSLRVMHLLGGRPISKPKVVMYGYHCDLGGFQGVVLLTVFPRAEQERLKREYHSIRQTDTETSTEFMHRFFRLAGFLGVAAGTAEEQAKNFQWGLR
nr:zinc finger, CCHC-type, retrotransposon Gag domain protein [Tanacetum cinerariifolium]